MKQKETRYLVPSLQKNMEMLTAIFGQDTTIKVRPFQNQINPEVKCCLFFVDGMVNNVLVNEHIIEPVMLNKRLCRSPRILTDLKEQVLFTNDILVLQNVDQLLSELLSGNSILLADGSASALSLATRGWTMRSIGEPPSEKVLQGPREGFTEALLINLSLIRRKLCNPDLKFQFKTLGKQTQTKIAVCYIDGIVNPGVLSDLLSRLDRINIDGILDTNYVEELIKDAPYSPFKTTGSTERPDVVAAKLLEGRVAVIVDGSPVALTAPFFFIEYFQFNDDYYNSFFYGSFGRLLRICGFFVTLSLPAVYLSLVTFHQELLPTRFLLNLSESRLGLPFPTVLEMIILILAFELIREGGSKVPASFGQTLSIVGGLVLGQASVEAKLVSIPTVIIVAFTGITGLMIPHLKSPVILLRLLWLVMSSVLGIFGYLLGVVGLLIHLSSMQTFGIPYTSSLTRNSSQKFKDTLIRAPWAKMLLRPAFIAENPRRQQPQDGENAAPAFRQPQEERKSAPGFRQPQEERNAAPAFRQPPGKGDK